MSEPSTPVDPNAIHVWMEQKSVTGFLEELSADELRRFAEDHGVDTSPHERRSELIEKLRLNLSEELRAAARPATEYEIATLKQQIAAVANASVPIRNWHERLSAHQLDARLNDLSSAELKQLVSTALPQEDCPENADRSDLLRILRAHTEDILSLSSPEKIVALRQELEVQQKHIEGVESRLWLTDAVTSVFKMTKKACITWLAIAAFIGLPTVRSVWRMSDAVSHVEELEAEAEQRVDTLKLQAAEVDEVIGSYGDVTSSFESTFETSIMHDLHSLLEQSDIYHFELPPHAQSTFLRYLVLLNDLRNVRADWRRLSDLARKTGPKKDAASAPESSDPAADSDSATAADLYAPLLEDIETLLKEAQKIPSLKPLSGDSDELEKRNRSEDLLKTRRTWFRLAQELEPQAEQNPEPADHADQNSRVQKQFHERLSALSYYVHGLFTLAQYKFYKEHRSSGLLNVAETSFDKAIELDSALIAPYVYKIVVLRHRMSRNDGDPDELLKQAEQSFESARKNALQGGCLRLFVRAANNMAYYYVKLAELTVSKDGWDKVDNGTLTRATEYLDNGLSLIEQAAPVGFSEPIIFTTKADAHAIRLKILKTRYSIDPPKDMTEDQQKELLKNEYTGTIRAIKTAVQGGFDGYRTYGPTKIFEVVPHLEYLSDVNASYKTEVLTAMGF